MTVREIDEVQETLDKLRKKQSYSLHNTFLMTGGLFLIVFLLSITQSGLLFGALSVVSFVITLVSFLRIVADILHFKRYSGFSTVLALGVLLVLAVSYYLLWNNVIRLFTTEILILVAILFFLEILFYLLHAYLAYYHNKAREEALITGFLILSTLFLLLAAALFSHTILYLLLLIALCFSIKAVLDFSERIVKK